MTAIGNLKEPIIEGGIKNPYFFNGRLLTAEALQDEQNANSFHRRQLGRILGEGAAEGMEVSIVADGTGDTSPTISITPGLALNRAGRVLELTDTVHLKLVREDTSSPGNAGLFAPCGSVSKPGLVPTGTGVYILAASPGSGYEGKAPMHYPGDTGKLSGCNYKYEKDGVQFRLVLLDITNTSVMGEGIGKEILNLVNSSEPAGRSKLRNLLAHLCLGTETAARFSENLFNSSGSTAALREYGPLDALRQAGCLEDIDVPLALILWTNNGLEFTDMWSVRRKVHSPYIFKDTPYPFTARRTAELEATYLQFQEQINTLYKSQLNVQSKFLSSVYGGEYFRYLPSVGIIPLAGEEAFVKEAGDIKFFKGFTGNPPVLIDGARLRPLLEASFSYNPIDLEKKQRKEGNELIVLFRVRQNIEAGMDREGVQPYLVFASGYIPYQADGSIYDYV